MNKGSQSPQSQLGGKGKGLPVTLQVQRKISGTVLPSLNLKSRWRWVINATLAALPTGKGLGTQCRWAPGPVRTGMEKRKFLSSTEVSPRYRQFQTQSCPCMICGEKFMKGTCISLTTSVVPNQLSFHQLSIPFLLSSSGQITGPLQRVLPHSHSLALAQK